MSQGRKPVYPQAVRDAVIGRVLDDGHGLTHVIRDLNAGTLEGFEACPVGYSTAFRWVDREKARRARNTRPDMAAYNAAAERLWRVIGRELDKMEREARSAKPLDVKRVREMLGTLREAKALIAQDQKPKTQQKGSQQTEEPKATDGFLASLPDPSSQTQTEPTDTPESKPTTEPETPVPDQTTNEPAIPLAA